MAGVSWPTLAAGSRARGSDVELKFDWIEGDLVPMLAGSKTTGAYDLGTSAFKWRSAYFSTRVNVPAIGLSDTSFISFDAGGTSTVAVAIKLASGASVNEFSIDGTLGGNSDLAVPTEKAVKTYADARLVSTISSNAFSSVSALGVSYTLSTSLSITADGSQLMVTELLWGSVFGGATGLAQFGGFVGLDSMSESGGIAGTQRYINLIPATTTAASGGNVPNGFVGAQAPFTPAAGGHTLYLMTFFVGTGGVTGSICVTH